MNFLAWSKAGSIASDPVVVTPAPVMAQNTKQSVQLGQSGVGMVASLWVSVD
jgi:hypothetical protein